MTKKQDSQFWTITLFAFGVFMAALDNGIISAALTAINDAFHVSTNWGAWGVTLYTLGLAISVPIVGKFSDRFGRKKLFIIEVAIFGIGSLLVALSPNFTFYLIARFLQALGGGGIFIIGSSHVLSTMPVEKQGKALGMLGATNGIAAILGPNIGSMILDLTGNWHYLFLINVPIAIILIILGYIKIQETKEPSSKKLDFFGTVLLSIAVFCIMLGITNLDGVDVWESFIQLKVVGLLALGILVFLILLVYENRLEKRDGNPILPFKLLSKPAYLITLLIGAGSGALIAGMIFIPAFSQQVLGISQENAGYWMTPLALASGLGAGLGGALVDKKGPVLAVLLSGLVSTIGFLLFPGWVDTNIQFIMASLVAGAGMGILLGAPLNILATEKLSKDKGSALATLSLTRQLGMTLAPTIYAGFITRAFNSLPQKMETEFPNILTENIKNANLDPEQLQGMQTHISAGRDMNQMLAAIEKIPDPTLQKVIQDSIDQLTQNVAQIGYGGLFISAAVISACIFLITFILAPIRKRANKVIPTSR